MTKDQSVPAEPVRLEFEELFLEVLSELRAIAGALRRRSGLLTLSTTEIVNEAYLKLSSSYAGRWHEGMDSLTDRLHFKRMVARVMRHLLTDRARFHRAESHGGAVEFVTLGSDVAITQIPLDRYLDLNHALDELAAVDAVQAEVICLRFYGGFTSLEISTLTKLSVATVDRRLVAGMAWLRLWYEGKLA